MRAAVGDDGLGFEIGGNLPATAYGSFGYALLCSETMADVLELTERYWHLVGRETDLSIKRENGDCIMEVTLIVPMPAHMRRLVFETTFTSLFHGLSLLAGANVEGLEVWFDFPPPEHADKAAMSFKQFWYSHRGHFAPCCGNRCSARGQGPAQAAPPKPQRTSSKLPGQ